ncbi:hypothetical protein Ahia01_000278000, partial [Argonauta hians]
NDHVMCHTGGDVVDVCGETLRAWRRVSDRASIVDLKSAYLQLHVAEDLWPYQLVRYKGVTYCLTRLGFGLNSAPKIMARVLKTVLSMDQGIREATSSYIDDILVDETSVKGEEVVRHLARFGLVAKQPEPLAGGAALGLQLMLGKTGELEFRRGNELPELLSPLSRRELFSACGKLVGHYPVAGWLRVACSYVKRRAEGRKWSDEVGQETTDMMAEVMERVRREDPVRGRWNVPRSTKGVVWCDARSIALGVVLEVGGAVVEDAAWLRKKGDAGHINVAELDAVMKGVNLAIRWGLRDLEVRTDSATVHGWVRSTVTMESRVRTKGAAEMLIKRRLGILSELVTEFGLSLRVTFVPSERNKADALTRVRKSWLDTAAREAVVSAMTADDSAVEQGHARHHMGVNRTLYLARKVDPAVRRGEVERVVRSCVRCQSIDPAPVSHIKGDLAVEEAWRRLAVDVTHYRNRLYLSMVDCGSGRFAIWREIRSESAAEVTRVLEQVFLERGPVDEVVLDNGATFRSELLREMLDRWQVRQHFRAAYRPSGNGIVERNHRTIKAMAERSQISPQEATYWYNMAPREGLSGDSVPHKSVHTYEWRHPDKAPEAVDLGDEMLGLAQLGEEVWVKPPDCRCTTQWGRGTVTGVNSRNNVSVDGVPRHILDIRRVFREVGYESEESECDAMDERGAGPEEVTESVVGESGTGGRAEQRRSSRARHRPAWHADYWMGAGGGEEQPGPQAGGRDVCGL